MNPCLSRVQRFVSRICHRFVAEDFDQVCGSLAFTTLLSVVPLVAVLLGVMSAMPSFLVMVDELEGIVRNMLPERSAGLIIQHILAFSQKALNVTVAGLVVLVLSAFLLLQTVERAFNHVWHSRKRRSWWRRVGLYCALVVLWPLAVAYVVAAISFAVTLSSGLIVEQQWLHSLLSKATGVFVAAIFFAGLYLVVPARRVRLFDAAAGGSFASLGFLLMQKGFELYLSYFPSITLVYGAFATVPIFLLWLYLSWSMVLVGALVSATLAEFRGAERDSA